MSGSTTELSLQTAVDSDDNADYLTIALANSLRTIDGLFNNVTGHNHGGAHQGGAISASAIPAGTITSTMIADGTIQAVDLANGSVTNPKIADGAVNSAKLASDLTLAGTTQTANINIRGGSTAISWGDATHYLQYAPAGALNILAWTHDFEAGGTLRAKGGTLYLSTGNTNTVTSDNTNLICRTDGTWYVQNAAGSVNKMWLDTNSKLFINGNLELAGGSNDMQAQSISLLKGANQVIYWRDGSHYLQYAPAGDTNLLRFTHNIAAGGTLRAEGGPVTGNGAYVNSASSEKIKKLIETLDASLCLRQVEAVRPVSFEYLDPIPHWTDQRLGFIAEEVGAVLPQAGNEQGIVTEALLSVLWGAVRELAAQVQELKGQPA